MLRNLKESLCWSSPLLTLLLLCDLRVCGCVWTDSPLVFIMSITVLMSSWFFCLLNLRAGEGVPDWPYYPVLAKFLEGRTEFGDSYDAGSHSYTEPEARPGASHHHPGELSPYFGLVFFLKDILRDNEN